MEIHRHQIYRIKMIADILAAYQEEMEEALKKKRHIPMQLKLSMKDTISGIKRMRKETRIYGEEMRNLKT